MPINHTCKSLRLDLDAAMCGKTWLLLPEGHRDQQFGHVYQLPTRRSELQKLVSIPIPMYKRDAGTIYLRRALTSWKSRMAVKPVQKKLTEEMQRRLAQAQNSKEAFQWRLTEYANDARLLVAQVHQEAEKAIASLTDLFALGREGLAGQMRAHLDGAEWQGERINASAFRNCFRMVTQAVKGLGLPSDQRVRAQAVIMEEAAEAIKATQDAVALAPGSPDETKN
jgi:hypothetical protein